jgi:sulfate transport system permease protein
MVVLPLLAVMTKGFGDGLGALQSALTSPGAVAAIRLTLLSAVATAAINAVFGTLLAYVLVRYRFPGRTLLSAFVDLPFAIPTLVTGVMLVALYGRNAPIGRMLARAGIQVALRSSRHPRRTCLRHPAVRREDRPARALGAGSRGGRGLLLAGSRCVDDLPPRRAPGSAASHRGRLAARLRTRAGEFGAIIVVSGNIPGMLTAPVFIFQLVQPVPCRGSGRRLHAAVRDLVRDRALHPTTPPPEDGGGGMSAGASTLVREGARRRLVRAALLSLALVYVALLLLLPIGGSVWSVVRVASRKWAARCPATTSGMPSGSRA